MLANNDDIGTTLLGDPYNSLANVGRVPKLAVVGWRVRSKVVDLHFLCWVQMAPKAVSRAFAVEERRNSFSKSGRSKN